MVPSTACPCYPCSYHQHGLPRILHSYPQYHLLASYSPVALQHRAPLLLDIYLHGHQYFSLSAHPRCDPFFPSPCFHFSGKILTQSPANPHLTSKSHRIIRSQLAQQILFSSFPNAHQISPRFCCSAFPVHKPALCWLPLPDSSLSLLSQPQSPPHQPRFRALLIRSVSPSSKPPTQTHCFLLSAMYSASPRLCTSAPLAILVSPKLH